MIPAWAVPLIAYGIWAVAALSADNAVDWLITTAAGGTVTFLLLGSILVAAGVV